MAKVNCTVRQASSNVDAKHYDTERIRKEYLVQNIMVPGEINMVYSMFDRIIAGGAVPVDEELVLEAPEVLRAEYFTQRREIGIINVGGTGVVKVGEEEYEIPYKEAIYIGRGNRHVSFRSVDPEKPAHFYFCSATAHKETGVKKVSKKDAVVMHLGSLEESNERTINRLLVKEVGHDDRPLLPGQEGLGGLAAHFEGVQGERAHGRSHQGSKGFVGRAHDAEVLRDADPPRAGGLDGAEGGEVTGAVEGVAARIDGLEARLEAGFPDDGIVMDEGFVHGKSAVSERLAIPFEPGGIRLGIHIARERTDAAVSLFHQMLRGGIGSFEVVTDNLRAGQVAEHTVELYERNAVTEDLQDVIPVVRADGVGHQHPRHLVVLERPERLDLRLEPLVGLADEDAVAGRFQDGLGSADDVGKEIAVNARDDDADDVGPTLPEIGRDDITLIAHFRRHLFDGQAGFLLHARTAGKRPRNRGRRHPEGGCYVGYRHHSACKDRHSFSIIQTFVQNNFQTSIIAKCLIYSTVNRKGCTVRCTPAESND